MPRHPLELTGVRVDNAFRLPGSDSSGLIVSVSINELKTGMTSHDFEVATDGDGGKPLGTTACLGMRRLGESDERWVLLGEANSIALETSYRALIESKAAVVVHTRRKPIDQTGQYEFLFLIGPNDRQGRLLYGGVRPDAAHPPVASFQIPGR